MSAYEGQQRSRNANKAYNLARGGDAVADGPQNATRSTAKARARVAQALLTEVDVPPPARMRQDQCLDKHISSRYLPRQIPFASLSCAELLSARDVGDLCRVFETYNVLPNRDDESQPAGWDGPGRRVEEGSERGASIDTAPKQSGPGAGGAVRRSLKGGGGPRSMSDRNTNSRNNNYSEMTATSVNDSSNTNNINNNSNSRPPRSSSVAPPPSTHSNTGSPAPPPAIPSPLEATGPIGKKKLRVGSGMRLAEGQLSREEHDRALTVEWVVELLLGVIARKITDASLNVNSHHHGRFNSTDGSPQTSPGPAASVGGGGGPTPPMTQTAVPMLKLHDATSTSGHPSVRGGDASTIVPPPTGAGISLTTTDAHHRSNIHNSTSNLESLTSLAGYSLGGAAGHMDTPASILLAHVRRKQLKEAALRRYKDELMEWAEPLAQPCRNHQHAEMWEICEKHVERLVRFHEVMQDDKVEVNVNYATNGILVTEKQSTTAGSSTTTARGMGASQSSADNNNNDLLASTQRVTLIGPSAEPSPHRPDTRVGGQSSSARIGGGGGIGDNSPPPTGAMPYQDPQRVFASADTQLCMYGEQTDGRPLPTWFNVLSNPSPWMGFITPSDGSDNHAPGGGKRPRRHVNRDHRLVFWSDLTNNIIMAANEGSSAQHGADTDYKRVPTMMLEEDHNYNNHNQDEVPRADTSTGSHDAFDEEEEEEQQTTMGVMGGSRRRRNMRRQAGGRGGITEPSSTASIVADLETFAEELQGLHTQSADHVLVSPMHRCIVTNSKDGVVKLWETKNGQFIGNLLNVGSSWVLAMYLMHDDQYLFVATSNSELTIVEFPTGAIVQKFRGCTTLITALPRVVQPATNHIQRFGIKLGECGPHRLEFKESMAPEVFHTLRKQAQLSHTEARYPSKAIEGYVQPTAFYLSIEEGVCVFGTVEGAVGCFDLSYDIRRSTLLSGFNKKPIKVCQTVQAHEPGTRVMGVLYCTTSHCIMSCGQDGSVTRIPITILSMSELQRQQQQGSAAPNAPSITLGEHTTFIVPKRPIRQLHYCPAARLFATVHSDRRVLLWNIGRNTSDLVHQLPQETEDIVGVAFRSEHQLIATLTADRCIRIYDFRGFRPLTVIPLSRNSENSVEDMASVTIKCSMEDADGCLMFFPGMDRIVCALRGPIMYDQHKPAAAETVARSSVVPASFAGYNSTDEGDDGADDEEDDEEEDEEEDETSKCSLPFQAGDKAMVTILSSDNEQLSSPVSPSTNKAAAATSAPGPSMLMSPTDSPKMSKRQRRQIREEERRAKAHKQALMTRRLQQHTTHRNTLLAVLVNRSTLEMHTFTMDRWKIWDLASGQLVKDVDIPRMVFEQLPMFRRILTTSVGWSTDACTRIIAGARGGRISTLDATTGSVTHAEELIQEAGTTSDLIDTDITVVTHYGTRTFICGGRTCVVRRYSPGIIHANGVEDFTSMSVRIPGHTTITSCCVVRDTHICLGTTDTRIYFFRMVENSSPYYEEILRSEGDGGNNNGEYEVGSVVGLFFLNEYNQNLLLIVLDTGVVQVMSYLTTTIISRFRIFRPHECRIRAIIYHRQGNMLVYGDSRGRIRVLDVSGFTSPQVDFRRSIRVKYDFQGAGEEVSTVEVVALHPGCCGPMRPNTSMSLQQQPQQQNHAGASSTPPSMDSKESPPMLNSVTIADSMAVTVAAAGLSDDEDHAATQQHHHRASAFHTPPLHASTDGASAPQLYIVVGALDGNVRIYHLAQRGLSTASASVVGGTAAASAAGGGAMATASSSLSAPPHHTNSGRSQRLAITVGLLGFDEWDLGNDASYVVDPLPVSAMPSYLLTQNEEFLNTVLREAKDAEQQACPSAAVAASVGRSGVSPVATLVASRDATPALERKGTSSSRNLGGGQRYSSRLSDFTGSRTSNNFRKGMEERKVSKVASRPASSGSKHRTITRRRPPPKPVVEEVVPTQPPTEEELFQAQAAMAHTIDTILPHTIFSGTGTMQSLFGTTMSRTGTKPSDQMQQVLNSSLRPQRTRCPYKYTRNPLLRTYPVPWLKKIGVIHPLNPLPTLSERDTPMLISAEDAFSPDLNKRLIVPQPAMEDPLHSEDELIGSGRSSSHRTRSRSASGIHGRFGAMQRRSTVSMPSPSLLGNPAASGDTHSAFLTDILPQSIALWGTQSTQDGTVGAAALEDAMTALRGSANKTGSILGRTSQSTEGNVERAPQFTTPTTASEEQTFRLLDTVGEEGAAMLAAIQAAHDTRHRRHSSLAQSITAAPSGRSTCIPRASHAIGRNHSFEAVDSAAEEEAFRRRRTHEELHAELSRLDNEVVEQRHDQLMLAHLAQQLDRVEPTGYDPCTFMNRVKQIWMKRTGDAAVVAATRAAALEAAGHPRASVAVPGGGGGRSSLADDGSTSNDIVTLHALIEEKTGAASRALPEDRLGLDLTLLKLPTEGQAGPGHRKNSTAVRSLGSRADAGVSNNKVLLSARERLQVQLMDLRRQRDQQAAERRRREEQNPNPRAWLPQASARQATHPVVVSLPSILQNDEGAQAQLLALHRLTQSAEKISTKGKKQK